MFKTLRNALKIEDIRKKLIFHIFDAGRCSIRFSASYSGC